jgi:catechol 2,3-dioxygenase-like lactoylglutathione lyase family enzyme
MRPQLTGVLETVLYYSDEEKTRNFYSEILGMRLMGGEPGRSLFYRAGSSVFLLFLAEETLKGGTLPPHGANGPIHTCFIVPPGEYERWKAYLVSQRIPVIQEVEWPGGALSFYFRDPAGNVLEIANGDLWPR